jgi:hypothetical protein
MNGSGHCLNIVRHTHLSWFEIDTSFAVKWSDDMEDSTFAIQAAMLHLLYRVAQIILYRPFTTRPSDSSAERERGFSDSCSVLCIAAARAIVRIVKSQKTGCTGLEFHPAYYAAGQLLLRIWDLKAQMKWRRNEDLLSLTQEIDELIADVYVVKNLYEKAQARWEFVQPVLYVLGCPCLAS